MRTAILLALWAALPLPGPAALAADPVPADDLDRQLAAYRAALDRCRREHGPIRALPPARFFLFGMGDRRKLVYARGRLSDARTGAVDRAWDVARDWILPDRYTVAIETRQGALLKIVEDEEAVWLVEGAGRAPLAGTRSARRLNLPAFDGPDAPILRVLHQEVLLNIVDGRPVPNFLVYDRPWYRDAAMMGMVLRQTGNLHLIRDWILGLIEPYDRNNAGEREADNPGQALYLISLVSDRRHPLVPALLRELDGLRKGNHIEGRSDFATHPVYQTRWAKYGLAALGLEDRLTVPETPDSYARLCWWDGARRDGDPSPISVSLDYPYLTWAEAHDRRAAAGPLGDRDYPLTWEANASQADYRGMGRLDRAYVEQRLCTPHTWHAAEAFLAIEERRGPKR